MEASEQSGDRANVAPNEHVKHIFPFSIYSIMARLTYAFPKTTYVSSVDQIIIVNKLVDLHLDGNITEDKPCISMQKVR